MILKVLKNVHLLDLYIKTKFSCSITIYMYLILTKMTKHFGTNQLFPLLKYMINISYHVIFHNIPFISPLLYIIPWAYRLSGWYHDLGLIKGMVWKMSCNNLYLLNDQSSHTFTKNKLLLILPEQIKSPPVLSGVRVTRSLVLCVCFVDRYFVILSFFFWPLCCLFFKLRILITSLWYLQILHLITFMDIWLNVRDVRYWVKYPH